MTDRNRDPHPDSMPQDNHERRGDLEQATAGNRDIENVVEAEGEGEADYAAEGVDGAVGGTGGVTKNQEDTAK
ncbi:hypothetical protein OK349_01815 [Sphingomonas sp. BT-65]|uniref:hypothetical protein n=1 Tax=Sphingomonas sp. BT-65 TaxID=2989821 RepID=UPI0022361A6C|nr:hypothetical protein [Sphingomonas sp. BT-65]MCW4460429.1 hypothetical protein [Sphingomonas sp. BT-65]